MEKKWISKKGNLFISVFFKLIKKKLILNNLHFKCFFT